MLAFFYQHHGWFIKGLLKVYKSGVDTPYLVVSSPASSSSQDSGKVRAESPCWWLQQRISPWINQSISSMLGSPWFFLCVLPKNIPISDEITILLAEFHWFLKSVLISDYVHLYDSYSQQTFFKARSPLLHLLSPARSPKVKGCPWSQRPMHWQMERNIVPCATLQNVVLLF